MKPERTMFPSNPNSSNLTDGDNKRYNKQHKAQYDRHAVQAKNITSETRSLLLCPTALDDTSQTHNAAHLNFNSTHSCAQTTVSARVQPAT